MDMQREVLCLKRQALYSDIKYLELRIKLKKEALKQANEDLITYDIENIRESKRI